jgi:hypothetical protein
MPLTNDGNERDVRLRPDSAPIPGADENLNGPIPPGAPCDTVGTQTDLPASGYTVQTPSATFEQQYDWSALADVCPRGFDMRTVETVLFKIVVSHFSNPDRIINPDLKSLIYTPNPTTTKLRVALNTAFDLPTSTKLPAVILKRGQQEFERIGINDSSEQRVLEPEIIPFVRRVKGTHLLMSVSSVPGETENLANELVDAFTCLSPVLRSELPFADFEVAGVTELQISDELGNRSVVAVQLVYKYELGWTLRKSTPLASRLALRTLFNVQS